MLLFETASRHMDWLSARQAVIAGNIANADTPGYHSRDVLPFEQVMQNTGLNLARTASGHQAFSSGEPADLAVVQRAGWDRSLSGNDVAIEAELIRTGEVNRAMTLDTSIVRSFHRMLLSSLKV